MIRAEHLLAPLVVRANRYVVRAMVELAARITSLAFRRAVMRVKAGVTYWQLYRDLHDQYAPKTFLPLFRGRGVHLALYVSAKLGVIDMVAVTPQDFE